MERDEIIEMAREAGIRKDDVFVLGAGAFEAFAKLVAAAEREACAKVCEAYQDPFAGNAMADAIRARGEE